MSSSDALVLILVFGSLGILILAVAFIAFLVWHQRRWMRAMEDRARDREALLEATSVGRLMPWLCAADGTGLSIGDSAMSLLQVSPREILNLERLLSFVPESQRSALRTRLLESPLHEDANAKVPMVDASGGKIITRWQFTRREDALKGVIRDISQEERLQHQLLQAQKLEAIGTLVGGVAHEFGNLLASVESCSRALERRVQDDPKGKQGIVLILDAAARGRSIIRKLLDFSRRDPELQQPVNLTRLVEEVATILRPLLGRSYQLALDLDPDVPAVIADPVQIHQALLNLCINARDAMPQGGRLRIRLHETKLETAEAGWRGKRSGRYLQLDVEDEGTGITTDHLAQIFQPFFTTKPPGQGTGLGLSVTHNIAESHGGFIQVESTPGRGSRFSLHLPVEAPRDRDPQRA